MFGSIKVNEKLGRYEINVLLNSLPYFKNISDKAICNLHNSITDNIGELLETGYFELPSKERVLDLLTSKSEYNRWSMLMINALMMLLLAPVEGFSFIHATPISRVRKSASAGHQ